MKLHDLKPAPGARRRRKRVGRGIGSGHGKTATRGHKGHKARSGGGKRPGFEGGQMPLHRRLPKRGFTNIFRKEYAIVNVDVLGRFVAGSTLDPQVLTERGIVKDLRDGLKVLGNGELKHALIVRAHKFSKSAAEKIQKAGGSVEIISDRQ